MYRPLLDSEYDIELPSAELVAGCPGPPTCALLDLWIEPHFKQVHGSCEQAPPGEVEVWAPTRYHVPLGKAALRQYGAVCRLQNPGDVEYVLVQAFRKGSRAPFAEALSSPGGGTGTADWTLPLTDVLVSGTTGTGTPPPLPEARTPLQLLPPDHAPYKLLVSIVPRKGASAVRHTRWVYLDDDAPLFGFEFEFVREKYWRDRERGDNRQYPLIRQDLRSWYVKMQEIAASRATTSKDHFTVVWHDADKQSTETDAAYKDRFVVTYPAHRWSFTVHWDPGTIEVNGEPLTRREYARLRELIQRDLFDVPAAGFPYLPPDTIEDEQDRQYLTEDAGSTVVLKPDTSVEANGAGHIHVGLRPTFFGRPRLAHDFLVSYFNFVTFGCGVFYRDLGNAPPLSLLHRKEETIPAALRRFLKSAADCDVSELGGALRQLQKDLYPLTFVHEHDTYVTKYQGLCLRSLDSVVDVGRWTFEIRTLRAERSVAEFLTLIEMLEKKIDALRARTDLLPFQRPAYVNQLFAQIPKFVSDRKGLVPEDEYYDGNAENRQGALQDFFAVLDAVLAKHGASELAAYLEGLEDFPPERLGGIVRFGP